MIKSLKNPVFTLSIHVIMSQCMLLLACRYSSTINIELVVRMSFEWHQTGNICLLRGLSLGGKKSSPESELEVELVHTCGH